MKSLATLPARGPSILELHGYFASARDTCKVIQGGFDREARLIATTKCALFAGRLARAPAGNVADVLLKLEAADWLDVGPKEALALIRADLQRVAASS